MVSTVLFSILAFIVIISIVVSVHELGHYFFAKIFGVKVEEFSIGFGKEIIGFNDRSGTRWKFCMIPAGGYVKLFGEINEINALDGSSLKVPSDKEKKMSLCFKPVYQKSLIAAGGPLANFIFALVVLFGFYFSFGKLLTEPVITSLKHNGPAASAGLLVGDRIIKVGDQNVSWFEDITRAVNLSTGEKLEITVLRGTDITVINVNPEIVETKDIFGNPMKTARLGIISDKILYSKLSILDSLKFAVLEIKNVISSTIKTLGQIILGKRDSSAVGGPIRIAKYSLQSFNMGFFVVLWFIAMLSINLGFVNLLPIPVLDGGHLVLYLIESIKGSAVAFKYQDYATKIGLFLLICIFLFATINDIFFIFK